MGHESKNNLIELPDREEITLCEAFTAFVYGRAWDAAQRHGLLFARMGLGPELTSEQSAKLNNLFERLNSAAYAGRIKFRALRNGENPADGHKLRRDIIPLPRVDFLDNRRRKRILHPKKNSDCFVRHD